MTESRRGQVQLTIAVDRSSAQIAEPIQLTLTVTAPEGIAISLPDPPESLGKLTVVDVQDAFDIPRGPWRVWIRTLWLESYSAGKQTIPPLRAEFIDTQSRQPRTESIESGPLEVSIASAVGLFASPARFGDVEEVVPLRRTWWEWTVWIILTALAVAAACAGGVVVYRRYMRRPPKADRWALAELDRLDRVRLKQRWDAEEFVVALTDVVRQYLQRRFGIQAPHLSTNELLEMAEQSPQLHAEHREALGQFLRAADLIKFARFEPTPASAREAIERARELVRRTAPGRQEPARPTIRQTEEAAA